MPNFEVDKLRTFAIIAHGGAGKTSLSEAMLFNAGAIDRLGNVDNGTTTTDYEPEEIARKISIASAIASCQYNNHKLNIIDTPGFINFLEDTRGCLRVSDGAVIIVSALSGVKAETERIWKFACEFEVPRIVFVNKVDKENADFYTAIGELEKSFDAEAIPLCLPIGQAQDFKGIVNLIFMKAYIFENSGIKETAMPDMPEIDVYRKRLVEKIAESDDKLLEKYLETGELSEDEIRKGIREGALTRRFIPVICGSATRNRGIKELLDAIILCLPSPLDMSRIVPIKGKNPKNGNDIERQPSEKEPFSAYVFKTISDPYAGKLSIFRVYSGAVKADINVLNTNTNTKERIGQIFSLLGKKQIPALLLGPGDLGVVAKLKDTSTGDTLCDESNPIAFERLKFNEPIISYAIAPKSKGDEEKVSMGLHRILDEDPALRFHRDDESKEMIISGMGQVHIEVALEKLKRKFGVEVIMHTPKIPYRETIKASAKGQGRYKKQSGGRGQYGDCWIEIEPLKRGGGYEFVDKIFGGVIPRQYISAVEKGIIEAMHEGVLAHYPMVDTRVMLYDGSYHSVDSSEMAFKIAGSLALKKTAKEARPVLLEPIMSVEVIVPEDALGAVIGDMNSRRGKVHGVEPQAGGNQKVSAVVPMAEMLTYANQLQSMTSGRGLYSMEPSYYDEVPSNIAQKIIQERAGMKKEEEGKT
ncbi:MAG: elongation factor G [Nitrospirae bacterium]|nr:elongation factor G [Nitrospirota bacterium]